MFLSYKQGIYPVSFEGNMFLYSYKHGVSFEGNIVSSYKQGIIYRISLEGNISLMYDSQLQTW